jgi:hypothetical protein
LLLALTLTTGAALAAKEKPPEVTHDGLHLVPGTEVAVAWVKPRADFSDYDKIMILEAGVAFRKNWLIDKNRTSVYHITKNDVEKMKVEMAQLFRETFIEVLAEEEGYPVVDGADADVLLLRPAIIDLDVTAPDVNRPGRSYNYAASAGAATLLLELYDSVSGEILARAVDRKAANYPGNVMRWSNKVNNRNEAKKILSDWAGLLRQRLDELHGKEEK